MNCYLYAKAASREQGREGFSIPAQRKLLQEYAAAKGLAIVREFVDQAAPDRKDFWEMVRLLENDPSCRVVLVEKTDRLYRNLADTLRVGKLIDNNDVEIHLVKEGTLISRNSRSNCNFVHDIQVALAKQYIDNLREEVKKAMLDKAQQGVYPGRAPYGYRNDKLTRTVVVDAQQSRVVKRIFSIYGARRHASDDAVRNLIQEEFGFRLSKQQIHRILRNKFYTGLFLWKGKTYSGTHPAIVSPQHFQRAQRIGGTK